MSAPLTPPVTVIPAPPPPPAAVSPLPAWLTGCIVVFMVFVVVGGSIGAYGIYTLLTSGVPGPSTAIEDAMRAHVLGEPVALESVADDLDSGKINPEIGKQTVADAVGVAIPKARLRTSGPLWQAISTGSVSENLRRAAAAERQLLKMPPAPKK
jgi:hypothetical protein